MAPQPHAKQPIREPDLVFGNVFPHPRPHPISCIAVYKIDIHPLTFYIHDL